MTKSDEAGFIQRAVHGDRDAFEWLVRSRQAKVYWTAYQVLGNEEDARDVAQQVFIRLWRVLPRYRREQRFDTWLYRITVNLAIDAHRRRQARPEVGGVDQDAVLPTGVVPGPGADLRRQEVQSIFLRLAGRLSAQQRAVFVLKEMNGLDTAEVAQVMGISQSTVRNHLHQARKVLRRGLETSYPEYLPADKKDSSSGEGA